MYWKAIMSLDTTRKPNTQVIPRSRTKAIMIRIRSFMLIDNCMSVGEILLKLLIIQIRATRLLDKMRMIGESNVMWRGSFLTTQLQTKSKQKNFSK